MSSYVKYNPELFLFERASQVSALLGEFILGESRLNGPETTEWVPIEVASFSCSGPNYEPDDKGTLIYQSETGSVSLSYWHKPADSPLYSADRVRASYDGKVLFLGTVDKTRWDYTVDAEAPKHGSSHRCDFSATLVGTYAAALGKEVCFVEVPSEPWIDRIRRWVDVEGWD